MKKTKHFNISVPELGDVPDITQVSNAISDLEDATAGTLEIMKAEMQGTKIALTSVSRKTKRTGYYEGMSIRFKSPQDIEPNYLKTISVDELGDQTLSVEYKVNRNEYIDIVYEGSKFSAYPVVVQKTDSVSNNSSILVGTAKGVKTAYDKGVEALDKANQAQSSANKAQSTADGKVSKSGDNISGSLRSINVAQPFIANYTTAHLIGGFARGYQVRLDDVTKAEFGMYGTDGRVIHTYIGKSYDDASMKLFHDGALYLKAINLNTSSKEVVTAINELNNGKEPTFSKKSGFNLEKTDNATNDTNKLFTAKGAYNLKNEVDTKVSKSGDTMTGQLILNGPVSNQMTILVNGENAGQVYAGPNKNIGLYNSITRHHMALNGDGTTTIHADNLHTSSKEVITAINELNNRLDSLNICPYNVGDVYITTKSGDPSAIWSGTSWNRIEGKFLLATSGGGATQQTGGSSSVTLGVNNMPSHNHSASQSSHSHTQPAHTHGGGAKLETSGGGASTGGGETTRYITESAGGENTGSAQPSISIGNTGGGQAFSIMPPYFTVHVWVRIG